MNNQPREKRIVSADGRLSVHSIFETIQGEGPFCGTPCVFVRLAGCNLQCPACDTDYTSKQMSMPVDSIVNAVRSWRATGLVVITGGEPFRQAIGPLLEALVSDGYYVQIETNGTLPPAPATYTLNPGLKSGVYIVCSPKTGKINPKIYHAACALKYVVRAGDILELDGLPLSALDHPSNPFPARPPKGWLKHIYVQPLDSKDDSENRAHIAQAVESCLLHGYTLQIQIHKHIGVE